MASPRDKQIVLTRELLTLRVRENDIGLTAFYLLALLSARDVQTQSHPLTFLRHHLADHRGTLA